MRGKAGLCGVRMGVGSGVGRSDGMPRCWGCVVDWDGEMGGGEAKGEGGQIGTGWDGMGWDGIWDRRAGRQGNAWGFLK